MNERTPICVPRENVNDETATLVAWYVPSGSSVIAGQDIAQVETSKAVLEIASPASGILWYSAEAGSEVPVGGEIALIVGPEEAAPPPLAEREGEAPAEPEFAGCLARPEPRPPEKPAFGTNSNGHQTGPEAPARFSRNARAWIERHGLDPARFAGRGLVRLSDLVAPEVPSGPSSPQAGPVVAASGVPARSEPLSRAKRTEARHLRWGLENTLPSVVSVACPTRGLRASALRDPELGGQASALILFEAARLLRKYPVLNAFHSDGHAHYYESVNIGFAVDAGQGLKVPVVRDADRKGPSEIAGEMRERVVEYLGGTLAVESLAGGTFTLTDLSGEGVVSFHPLINRGQSAILGIGGEVFAAGASEGQFLLVLAFDHQLAEGRLAARFLNDLSARLQAHEAALRSQAGAPSSEEPYCRLCQLPVSELDSYGRYLVSTVRPDRSARLICSYCLRGG